MTVTISAIVGYLVGSVPFGLLIAHLRGIDLRAAGSGNIGATNVGRVLGRRWGVLVFALDALKGALPTAGGLWLAGSPFAAVFAGLAAFIGHLFPIWGGFRGGKGVATGAGIFAVLIPGAFLISFLTWAAVLGASRYMSLASIWAAIAMLLGHLALAEAPFSGDGLYVSVFTTMAAFLVILRHLGNLGRLYRGQENRFADSAGLHTLGTSLHLFALGLACGSAVFFNFLAAPPIFRSFKELASSATPTSRSAYFDIAAGLSEDERTKLGNALAGAAVGPLFEPFFILQAVAALVVFASALCWSGQGRVNTIRAVLAGLVFALVAIGWPISRYVSQLRLDRYTSEAAAAAFGPWHGISLLLSLVATGLLVILLAMAGTLPRWLGDQAVSAERSE